MIYPMFFMVLLTFGFGVYTVFSRVSAVKSGEVNPRYFKAMSGYELPRKLEIIGRHFNNLLETPPLFYIPSAMIICLGIESLVAVILGWVYLGSRIAHMYIHNSYNHPLHRMLAFNVGLLCILGIWIVLFIRLA